MVRRAEQEPEGWLRAEVISRRRVPFAAIVAAIIAAIIVPNVHVAAQTDTVHELRYAGLTIRAYAPAGGPVLLQQIDVTSKRHPLPLELRYGKSTFDDVQHALGLPKDIEHLPDGGSRWRYDNVEGTASIIFEFEAEPSMKIRSVRWSFKVD